MTDHDRWYFSYEISPELDENFITYKIYSEIYFVSDAVFYVIFIGQHGEMKIEMKMREEKHQTKIEDWMIPTVSIVVFTHVTSSDEFIVDVNKVKVESAQVNELSIDLNSKNSFEPGNDLEMKLSVSKNNDESSSLHLLSVEERVRYFGNDNDITKDKLLKMTSQHYEEFDQQNDMSKFNVFYMTNGQVGQFVSQDCDFNISDEKDEKIFNLKNIDEISAERSNELSNLKEVVSENLLFEDISGTKLTNNEYVFNTKSPNSITSYYVNGFVFHPVHGLGIAKERKFTIFKEFFVKAFLPLSIHAGGVMKLNVAVFNYLKPFRRLEKVNITVEIIQLNSNNNNRSKFVRMIQKGKVCAVLPSADDVQEKLVSVESNSSNSTDFYLKIDQTVKKLKIKITASAEDRTDVISKTLTVEPYAPRKSMDKMFFVDLRETNYSSFSHSCHFPNDISIMKHTKKMFVSVHSNLLRGTLKVVEKFSTSVEGT